MEVIDEGGGRLPTIARDGRTYELGHVGQRYSLRVRNGSWRRVEVVAAVDGRDVLDGRPSDWGKRGYIVNPYSDVVIDGFRLNLDSVAAFRFSSVPQSYAARMGDARDVGVVGAAIFSEQPPRYVPPPPVRPVDPYRAQEERGAPTADMSADAAAQPSAPSMGEGHAKAARKMESRPGLGTEFGEQRDDSRVQEVGFVRASGRPDAVLSLRYNDRAGLLAMGIDVDGYGWSSADDQWLRHTADPFRRNEGSFAQPPLGWR
jgi:hypothetical protein